MYLQHIPMGCSQHPFFALLEPINIDDIIGVTSLFSNTTKIFSEFILPVV
jgi:hypothetical protein